jgi:hypothetical protein
MIFRLVVLAAIGWLVYRAWQQWQQKLRGPGTGPGDDDRGPDRGAGSQRGDSQRNEPYELMQRCSVCGTYLPSTTLSRSGRCGRCSE